uniref:Uncharacterized protein n=1 Tax=Salvator merianae TaxID=96440 RepID=A0A8D0B6H3_SALMN
MLGQEEELFKEILRGFKLNLMNLQDVETGTIPCMKFKELNFSSTKQWIWLKMRNVYFKLLNDASIYYYF